MRHVVIFVEGDGRRPFVLCPSLDGIGAPDVDAPWVRGLCWPFHPNLNGGHVASEVQAWTPSLIPEVSLPKVQRVFASALF